MNPGKAELQLTAWSGLPKPTGFTALNHRCSPSRASAPAQQERGAGMQRAAECRRIVAVLGLELNSMIPNFCNFNDSVTLYVVCVLGRDAAERLGKLQGVQSSHVATLKLLQHLWSPRKAQHPPGFTTSASPAERGSASETACKKLARLENRRKGHFRSCLLLRGPLAQSTCTPSGSWTTTGAQSSGSASKSHLNFFVR